MISKRILTLLVAVACSITVFSGCELGGGGHKHEYYLGECECGLVDSSIVTDGLVFEDIDERTCAVIGYLGSGKVVVIPSEYEGKTVTTIKERAFEGQPRVRNIIMPDSITTIETLAFNGCMDLNRITIPKGLKNLGSFAFWDCYRVSEIIYSAVACNDGVLEDEFFNHVGNYTDGITVTVKKHVKHLPKCIFNTQKIADQAKITSVVFEDDSECTDIRYCAFRSVTALKSIDLGKNSKLEKIGDTAFGNCYNLQGITLPASLKQIDSWAFSNAFNRAENPIVKFEDLNDWYIVHRSSDAWDNPNAPTLPHKITFLDPNNQMYEVTTGYREYRWEKTVQ